MYDTQQVHQPNNNNNNNKSQTICPRNSILPLQIAIKCKIETSHFGVVALPQNYKHLVLVAIIAPNERKKSDAKSQVAMQANRDEVTRRNKETKASNVLATHKRYYDTSRFSRIPCDRMHVHANGLKYDQVEPTILLLGMYSVCVCYVSFSNIMHSVCNFVCVCVCADMHFCHFDFFLSLEFRLETCFSSVRNQVRIFRLFESPIKITRAVRLGPFCVGTADVRPAKKAKPKS